MKILLIVIISLTLILIFAYGYYGGFKKLNIQITLQGGETVVYEDILGDYRQTGIVMDKVYYTLLNDYKIETFKGYGKYIDNPKKTETSKLRSEAGCIIEKKDLESLSGLSVNFNKKILPVEKYITTEFPYKGKISVFFSIMRVYPLLNKFAKENNMNDTGAVTEIYDIPNKRILYRKEID